MYYIVGCLEEREQNDIILKSTLYDSEIKLSDEIFKKEYYSLKKNGCKSLHSFLEKELNMQGMLLNEYEIKQITSTLTKHYNEILLLTIMPTESCNFRCAYCYENHDDIVMNEDIIQGLEKYIENSYHQYNHISISWFGGEPTLCKKTILRINQKVKKLLNCEKKYSFSMTTNGYLLDIDTFIEYYKSGITSYQITLDGWKQDKNRPLKNGEPTLERILNNLDAIHRLPSDIYKFNIMIRNNIYADNSDFTWYKFLRKKYGDDERFGILVRQVGNLGGDIDTKNILSEKEGKLLIQKHVEYIDKLRIRCDNNGIEKNLDIGRGMCYASYKNGYTIRANGKVQKCTVAFDLDANEVGYLDSHGYLHINEEKNKIWSDNNIAKDCYSCNKIFTCLNKMCPLKKVTDKTYKCNEYQSFFTQTTLNDF